MVIHSDNKLRVGDGIHGSGTITKTTTAKPTKVMCHGCRDDFYNRDGNGMGGNGCWMFKDAKVVNKVGYSSIHVPNGPDTIMKGTLNCWHGVRH